MLVRKPGIRQLSFRTTIRNPGFEGEFKYLDTDFHRYDLSNGYFSDGHQVLKKTFHFTGRDFFPTLSLRNINDLRFDLVKY